MNLLENITKNVCDSIREKLGLHDIDIPLIKRNKTLKNGDFQIPLSGLRKLNASENESLSCQIEDKLCDGPYGDYICRHSLLDDTLFLFLQKHLVFKEEISHVLTNKDPWSQNGKAQSIVVTAQFSSQNEKKLSHLRTILLAQHMAKLLQVNGYTVNCTPPHTTELGDLFKNGPVHEDQCTTGAELYERLQNSQFCEKCEANSVIVNYKEFLEKHQLQQGKDQYDKNIEKGIVTSDDEKLKMLSSVKTNYQGCTKEPKMCIHVTAANLSFTIQQVDLLWQMLGSAPIQKHVAHGPVIAKTSSTSSALSADEFLSLREEETRQAFHMKYGDSVSGDKWIDIIKELSRAAIKFDLLSTSCKHIVKLDITHPEDGECENRAGVFVVYNYARLATLMQHFSKAVSNGTYPPMPDVTDINFSLLKEEGEWELMFNYVLPYSNLLKESIAELAKDIVKPNIHTHKICQFLLDLSRDLSSYYSRVHVLGEGLEHLLPQMYARLSLLQAVKKLMEHGLQTLNITPISQL